MSYLLLVALISLIFLYLSIYIDMIFLFGFTSTIMVFIYLVIRVQLLKVIQLLFYEKKQDENKESADDHPIIKSARERLKK